MSRRAALALTSAFASALVSLPAPALAVERFAPGDLLADPAWVAAAPGLHVAGDALVLDAAAGPAPGLFRAAPAGDFRLRVHQSAQGITQAGYQAILQVLAVGPAFVAATGAGPRVGLSHKIHDSIDRSWFRLFDDAGHERSANDLHRQTNAWLELSRTGGVFAARWRPAGEGTAWQTPDWAADPASPRPGFGAVVDRLGVQVDRFYNAEFSIEISEIQWLADTDADTLPDDEERLLGTSVDTPDTDADGVPDADDAWPLWAARSEAPPAFLPVAGAASGRVQRGVAGWVLSVENPITTAVDAPLALPGLAADTVVRRLDGAPAAELLPAAGGGTLRLPADDRALFALEVDFPPVAAGALAEITAPLDAGAVMVGLSDAAVDPEGGEVTWRVLDAGGAAVDLAGGLLVVHPGAACGAVHVTVEAVDAAGGTTALTQAVRFVGGTPPELAQGGDFSGAAGEAVPAPWIGYVWEGDFRLGVDAVGGADGGPAGRVLGDGPGKAALRQGFALSPGRYRLLARVASAELRPGLFNQTSTLYLSGHAAAPLNLALVGGDSGWRTATLVFDVEPGFGDDVIAYFFGWGPGALYVDDLHLSALPACDDTAPGFTLGPVDAPLTAMLPAAPADDLLCGYCPALGGELCARCAGLPAPAPPLETRVLTDFEPGRPMPFERGTFVSEAQVPVAGTTSARLVGGRYLSGAPANGLPTDWRGYDGLRFEVENPSGAAVDFVVEIRDAQTRDYWSRVNWYTTAPPGRHTLHVPLQVFVGEKSVIRERRRLALEAITRLVLLNAGTTDLLVDDVRLEAEPPLPHDDPRILKLDAGPSTGPVFPGFTPLLASTDVRPRRAYGFRPDTRFGRIEDRRHPEALRRDWISISSGGLEIALPPGRYAVWMVLEDPGYWEYFPNYTRRVVRAEGAPILDESPTVADFWARYYAHADDEVLPGDDAWARFVDPRYTPLRAEVDVVDGGLTLDFEGSTYACALSALVIAPADDPNLDFEGFLAGLDDRMRQHFADEYTGITSPAFAPDPAPAALEVAWVAPGRFLRADEPVPAEGRDAGVTLSALRGAVATQSVALRRDAADTLVTATLTLPGLGVTLRRVRHLLDRVTADGAVYQVAPRLLDPLSLPLDLPAGVTRQLVFEVDAPVELPVDRVEGTLTLGLASGAEITRAVTVEVSAQRAVALSEAGLQVGYLGLAPTYPQAVYPEVAEKQRAEVAPALDLLRRAGMSAVTGGLGGPALTGFDAAGEAQLDLSTAAPVLDAVAARAADFAGPVSTYGGGALGGVPLYAAGDALFGRPFAEGLRAFLAAWEAARAARGWPDLRVTVGDEPAGDAIASGVALAQAVRATGTGVETDVFTSFTALDDPRAAFIGNVDLMLLTHHSAEGIAALQAADQGWGLYNQGGRYRRGVYLFALRAAGLRAYYQFAFSSVGADPYYALDAREDDLCAAYTHPSGALVPTVDFALFTEAVGDLRALLTLEAAVDAAPFGPARDAAAAFLSGVVAAVPIGHAAPETFDAAALDALRADTFAHLRALADPPVLEQDAGVDAADLGVTPTPDQGVPAEDAAIAIDLGAIPTLDLGLAPTPDAGAVSPTDAGAAPSPDAAHLVDAAPELGDLGATPTLDADRAPNDALQAADVGPIPEPDLGATADAEHIADAGRVSAGDEGCDCRAASGPAGAAPFGLLLLAALPRWGRRRASVTCRR